jgi:hypothetical protein
MSKKEKDAKPAKDQKKKKEKEAKPEKEHKDKKKHGDEKKHDHDHDHDHGEFDAEAQAEVDWVDSRLEPFLMSMINEAFESEKPERVGILANTLTLIGIGLLQQMFGDKETAGFLKDVTKAVKDGEMVGTVIIDGDEYDEIEEDDEIDDEDEERDEGDEDEEKD